jgi:enoyl-CoA hydratase
MSGVNREASSGLLVERDGSVLVIILNRPHARNAATLSMAVRMAAVMDELDNDTSLIAGVITGADGTFCAGMDLKAFVEGEMPTVEGRGFMGLVEKPPAKPLLAAVEGFALAGGFEVALACDLIVAATTARFGLPEVKRGLVAAAGGLIRLPETIPPNIAMEIALTGEAIGADRAYALGLVNRIVLPGQALDEALSLAQTISRNGPLALAASKRVIKESRHWPQHEQFERQKPIVNPVLRSLDAIEGATAFSEKRAAQWTGS